MRLIKCDACGFEAKTEKERNDFRISSLEDLDGIRKDHDLCNKCLTTIFDAASNVYKIKALEVFMTIKNATKVAVKTK